MRAVASRPGPAQYVCVAKSNHAALLPRGAGVLTLPSALHGWQAAEADLLRISNKVRFILAVVSGQLRISNRRKADIEAELEREGYDRLPSNKKKQQVGILSSA